MHDPSESSDQRPVDRHPAVLEASPNAIVAVRDDGRIAYADPQVATTFGHRPADLIGRPVEVSLSIVREIGRQLVMRPSWI